MSGIGASGNNNPNNSPTYTQYELSTSAWSILNKAALGITMDTVDQSFTQVNPRYIPGYMGGFGYKSDPSRPLLDHPIEMGLTASSPPSSSTDWLGMYDQLVQLLPSDEQQALLDAMQQPLSSRPYNMVVLNQSLTWAAQVFTQMGYTASEPEPGSVTLIALGQNSITLGSSIGQNLQDYINSLGPNDPDFYPVNEALNSMYGAMTILNGVMAAVSSGTATASDQAQAALVADAFISIASQFSVASGSQNFQMLGPVLGALSIIAGALALPYSGSGPLYVSLSLGLIGSDTSGVINSDLATALNALIAGISPTIIPGANSASQNFLSLLTVFAATVVVGLASLASMGTTSTTDGTSTTDQANLETAQFLALVTTLGVMSNANLANEFFNEAVAVSGGDSTSQTLASSVFASLVTVLAAVAGTTDNNITTAADVLQQVNTGLQNAVDFLQQQADQLDPKNSVIDVALGQMNTALQDGDYQSFLNALNTLVDNTGNSSSAVLTNINSISVVALAILQAFTAGSTDYTEGMVKII